METISIDIETYSGNDLNKCGVYKYVQHPDFDILLFGYAVDGGEVHVVDLAAGEEIPEEIVAALSDEDVTKWAFNSNFERICLSEWLRRNRPEHFSSYGVEGDSVGEYLDPRGWKCSMIWSVYMGLPLSLAGVGTVLGLEEQKLKEGKDLIRYFCVPCKPTKSNGGRTRKLPEHDPEKWDLFKFYNLRNGDYEALSMFYDSVPNVLSELIRTSFVAGEGNKFCVADFSAIEARVLSWLAGEQWRTDVFVNKEIFIVRQLLLCSAFLWKSMARMRNCGRRARSLSWLWVTAVLSEP